MFKAVRSSTSPSLDGGSPAIPFDLHACLAATQATRLVSASLWRTSLTAALALSLAPGVGTDHASGRSVLYYVGWVDSLVSVRSAITVEASVPARPTAEQRFRNGHGFALK